MKYKIRIKLSDLKFQIKETVNEILMRTINHSTILNCDPIVEMSKLNVRQTGAVPFPSNKFDVRIWSTDHNPPHFHVRAEGWDISFLIENGEEYRVNKHSNDSKMYSYITNNVKKWLTMPNKIYAGVTNKQVAANTWLSYHDDEQTIQILENI